MVDPDIRKVTYCLFVAAAELDPNQTEFRTRYGKKRVLSWNFSNGVVLRLETLEDNPLIPQILHAAAMESGKSLAKTFSFGFEVAQGGSGGPGPG